MEIIKEPSRPYKKHIPSVNIKREPMKAPFQDLSFLGGPRKRKGRKLIQFQFLSALVDALIILGMTLLLCSVYMTALKTETGRMQFLELFSIIFCWFQFCYLVLLRAYLGYTLGEKAFNIRLGLYQERFLLSYPFRVIFRTIIILATGIVLLPILSWFFEKDMAGEITNLKIISLV